MVPRLTVVVPVYNVESFLEDCLRSIAAQSLAELDIVMIDDGSTDSSAEIAAEFAAQDPRFRLIRQENQGLGAARNAGIRASDPRTEYLTFVDSDDVIPEYAYRLCLEVLNETGSDFASGNVHLLDSKGTRQSPMHRGPMKTSRLRTHITRDRSLVGDRLAPNKVFRRSFWERNQFAFPEGVLYEDIPVTIPAHFLAKTVDVLTEPIYYWRQRESGGPSITQRRTEPQAVRDRINGVDEVSRFLASCIANDPAYEKYKRWYDKSVIDGDIKIFLNILPEVDDEFRALFLQLANDYMNRVDLSVLDELPAIMRLKWHLVRKHKMAELLEVLAYERKKESIPVVRRLHRYAKYPFFDDSSAGIPKELYRLDQELKLKSRLTAVDWQDGKMVITGFAHVNNINVHKRHMSLKVVGLRHTSSKRVVLLPTRTTFSPETTATSGQSRYSYDYSGFEFTLDPKKLRHKGEWVEGKWRVNIGVFSRGLLRRSTINTGASGSAVYPPYKYVDEDIRIVPTLVGSVLRVHVEHVRVRIIEHSLDGDTLVLVGRYAGVPVRGTFVRLRHTAGVTRREYPITVEPLDAKHSRFVVRIPLADFSAHTSGAVPGLTAASSHAWRLHLVAARKPTGIVLDEDLPEQIYPFRSVSAPEPDVTPWELSLQRNAAGHIVIYERAVRPRITRFGVATDGTILIAGVHTGMREGASLALRYRDHHEEHLFPAHVEGDAFRVEFNPATLAMPAGTVPMRSGRWDLFLRRSESDRVGFAVKIDGAIRDRFPHTMTVGGRRYELETRGFDHITLHVHSDLRDDERGPYRQRMLRTRYFPEARKRPLRNAVLYDSYSGKQYSDSPRAVHEELVRRGTDVEHLWVVRDGQIDLPPNVTAVRLWGEEWYDALARAKYIVTNGHLPDWIERRPGQVVVQAWHGTPLKKIGHDIDDVQFANSGYLEKVAREAKQWSFLISPNSFSTPILRRAFRFEGEILASGYPRNDILYSPDRAEISARVRERLGIPMHRKVVLYAPTWRDDQFYGPGRYKLDMQIDLDKAAAELGDDHVLLVRRHPNIVDSVPGAGEGFVWDVSSYPDIAELFLAADILVTDYSSLMFDYANTGRPMLFFTYDLEHYRDKLRGFYFDFEAKAPGPLLGSSDELIAAIRDVDSVQEQYRDAYDAFRADFCDLDDGDAAGRVIDRMIELGRD